VGERVENGRFPVLRSGRPHQPLAHDLRLAETTAAALGLDVGEQVFGKADGQGLHAPDCKIWMTMM
jgi:hypothetical protein